MTTEHVYFTKGENAGQLREVSAQEAQNAKVNGEGHVANMSEYNEYKQRADAALNRYRALERKLKTTDDPRLGTTEMKEYELAEKWAELTEEIAVIDDEWTAKRAEIEEAARQATATHSVSVTTNDTQVGSQLASRYVTRLAAAQTKVEQESILTAMTDDISRLTDAQRVALQSYLLPLNGVVREGVSAAEVFNTASQMQSPDAVAVDAVKAFPWRASTDFHNLRVIKEQLK